MTGDRPHFRGERGGHHGGHHGRGPHHGGRPGGPAGERGGRARRGEAKYLFLDVLRDGPKHGYEIIKKMEERSNGRYAPSPGVIYPTLQFLSEAGLVRADQSGDRRVFHLTEAGQAELATHLEEVASFWAHFESTPISNAAQTETMFLQEELEYLQRAVWSGLQGTGADNTDRIRRIRQAIEGCRNQVRSIIAQIEDQEESATGEGANNL